MMRKVAITGIGVIAPGGIGRKSFWEFLISGSTATRRISLFDPSDHRCQVAAECDFDPVAHGLSPQEIHRTDRVAQLAKSPPGRRSRTAAWKSTGRWQCAPEWPSAAQWAPR
jgi:act minimal PKS ketosynthase (KS/KS alpha)